MSSVRRGARHRGARVTAGRCRDVIAIRDDGETGTASRINETPRVVATHPGSPAGPQPRAATTRRNHAPQPRAATTCRNHAPQPRAATTRRNHAPHPRAAPTCRTHVPHPRAATARREPRGRSQPAHVDRRNTAGRDPGRPNDKRPAATSASGALPSGTCETGMPTSCSSNRRRRSRCCGRSRRPRSPRSPPSPSRARCSPRCWWRSPCGWCPGPPSRGWWRP